MPLDDAPWPFFGADDFLMAARLQDAYRRDDQQALSSLIALVRAEFDPVAVLHAMLNLAVGALVVLGETVPDSDYVKSAIDTLIVDASSIHQQANPEEHHVQL